jgi:hypothetical protein
MAMAITRAPRAPRPVGAVCESLGAGLMGQGHADDDMSAVARSIRGLSGLES